MTSKIRLHLAALSLGIAGMASLEANAAESYDSCAGYIESLPATISTQGTWCLRHDLATSMASGTAIQVNTNNVTIDCNDFKIGGLTAGDSSLTVGIKAVERSNITVRNCNIRGFHTAIFLDGLSGGGHLVEHNRLDNNLLYGIRVFGSNNHVQYNRVYDTGGYPMVGPMTAYGIWADAHALENTVTNVVANGQEGFARGIWIDVQGAEIRNNVVSGIVSSGTGTSAALQANARGITLVDNRVYAALDAPADFGIVGGGFETFCIRNTATGFGSNFFGCEYSLHNLSPP